MTTRYFTHNAGNLNEYDTVVIDGGRLSATVAAAMAGSAYGLQCTIDATDAIYGRANLTGPATYIDFRFYIDPNTITMANGDAFIVAIYESSFGWIANSYLVRDATTYRIGARYYDDAGTNAWVGGDTFAITDAPHYVKVVVVSATGAATNNGTVTLWCDGVQLATQTGIDNYHLMAAVTQYFSVGANESIDAGTLGTFYMDECSIANAASNISKVSKVALASIKVLEGTVIVSVKKVAGVTS
jgi:hypothetical protein